MAALSAKALMTSTRQVRARPATDRLVPFMEADASSSPQPPVEPMRLGWREWVRLPELVTEPIKAKLDTGARTSTLHAFWIEPFEHQQQTWLRFAVHPRRRKTRAIECQAPISDRRWVTDSGGHREHRYIIETCLTIGAQSRRIEMTLTNRDNMLFPMLLGRTALRQLAWVDPAASYTLGRPKGRKKKKRSES
jgi:hypothetical protein